MSRFPETKMRRLPPGVSPFAATEHTSAGAPRRDVNGDASASTVSVGSSVPTSMECRVTVHRVAFGGVLFQVNAGIVPVPILQNPACEP